MGNAGGSVGFETLGRGGGAGGGEVGSHEREQAVELHVVDRIGGEHGPLAREVRLHFKLPTFGRLVAVVGAAEETAADREERVELVLRRGAEGDRVVLGRRLEAGEGGGEAFVQQIETQAGLDALAGAREAGPAGEFKAHAVGEEGGLEVAAAERQPRKQAEDATVGLIGGVGAMEPFVGDIVAGGVEDRLIVEIDEAGFAGGRERDGCARAVLSEVVAAETRGGPQPAGEKRAE